jgi:hypothetical protein
MMMTGPMFKLHVNTIWRTSPETYALSMVSQRESGKSLLSIHKCIFPVTNSHTFKLIFPIIQLPTEKLLMVSMVRSVHAARETLANNGLIFLASNEFEVRLS